MRPSAGSAGSWRRPRRPRLARDRRLHPRLGLCGHRRDHAAYGATHGPATRGWARRSWTSTPRLPGVRRGGAATPALLLQAPARWNWDLTVFKNFGLGGEKRLQLRVGFFNLFNQAAPTLLGGHRPRPRDRLQRARGRRPERGGRDFAYGVCDPRQGFLRLTPDLAQELRQDQDPARPPRHRARAEEVRVLSVTRRLPPKAAGSSADADETGPPVSRFRRRGTARAEEQSTDMADETRRTIVRAGMAGAVARPRAGGAARLRPMAEAREGGMAQGPADRRAPGLRRPSGERFRRRRFRRPRAHARANAPGGGRDREDGRHALPADAHHLLARDVLRVRARRRPHAARGDRRHSHGRPLHLAGGRASRRPLPRVRPRGRRGRLPAAPGRRRGTHPPGDARPGDPGGAATHRAPGGEQGPRGDRAHGRERGADRRRRERRRDALHPPRQRLRPDAAAPPERDLGAARRRPPASRASSWTGTTCRRRR